LRALFSARGVPMLPHDTDIGGRYSAFTNVGMIPAFARGLDFSAFRRGARDVVLGLEDAASPRDFAPAISAAIAVGLAMEKGIANAVLMAYSDRLRRFGAWYVQLWAESLGKGGNGTTPIAALGPVDQHSQLQLFMDGPRLHCLTILRVVGAGRDDGLPIDEALAAKANAAYLAGRGIGDLVRAQQRAMADALVAAGRPVRTIDCDRLDEYTLGALMMHFMIETILAAHLLGVDPFDQPAVELGKKLTRDYLASRDY
jgi:glucose-6-phosphate isomerase